MAAKRVRWLDEPEEHDYAAALAYLSLVMDPANAATHAAQLATRGHGGHLEHGAAKDILRASALPLLPPDNVHVAKDLTKITSGKALSPVLLVRWPTFDPGPLIVADGYHRVCACEHHDENTVIPFVIV